MEWQCLAATRMASPFLHAGCSRKQALLNKVPVFSYPGNPRAIRSLTDRGFIPPAAGTG